MDFEIIMNILTCFDKSIEANMYKPDTAYKASIQKKLLDGLFNTFCNTYAHGDSVDNSDEYNNWLLTA